MTSYESSEQETIGILFTLPIQSAIIDKISVLVRFDHRLITF